MELHEMGFVKLGTKSGWTAFLSLMRVDVVQSSEEVYDKECGNMPGFATFYRDPNSARVTFEQYVRVWIFQLVIMSWRICARNCQF